MKGLLRLSSGRKLLSPTGSGTRPTTGKVREAVMNILDSKLKGASWLELCSGSGVMSCEAFLKGVKTIVAVEKNPKIARISEKNLESTAQGINHITLTKVITKDVINFLNIGSKGLIDTGLFEESQQGFDLVYFDPPYDSQLYEPVLKSLLENRWINDQSVVICEHHRKLVINPPEPLVAIDRRLYGKSALLILSLPKGYSFDIDSMLQQTSQAK